MARRLVRVLVLILVLTTSASHASADTFPGYERLARRARTAWKKAPSRANAYLVLVPEKSPLEKAAKKLAAYRRAEVVSFAPDEPADLLETLVRKGARYVAVFVEPSDMDVNLLRRMIVLSTLMDEDPFCDFAFGFFTGSNPEQVEALVERSITADRKGVEPYAVQCSTSNISHKYAGSSFVKGMSGDNWYVKLGDMEYARKALADLRRAGFIHLGGCADPEGVWMFDDHRNAEPSKHWRFDPKRVGQDPDGEMPRLKADDFRGLDLQGAVVWTHACHIGSVGRMWVEGDIVSTFGRCQKVEEYVVPKERSVCLAILEAGASAYIAPLGPNFGAQSDIEQAVASELGLPLGDVMRRAYHDVVMDTEGHPDRIGLYVTGKPARWDPDDFVNNNSPHNRALYGDPLLQPFGEHRSPATVEIAIDAADKSLSLRFRVADKGYLGRTWYGNRGRTNRGRGRIYEVIQLEGDPVGVTIRAVEAKGASGEPFAITRQTAQLERIDGATHLHVQLVTDDPKALREEGATVTARLDLTPRKRARK